VAATAYVVTAKVAVAAPELTVTVAGTDATAELDDARVTVRLPTGALAERVTVPVAPVPPVTLAGEKVTEIGLAEGLTVTVAVFAVLA
jgi:pectin methylesterase-like acyl-CoA thioesterase